MVLPNSICATLAILGAFHDTRQVHLECIATGKIFSAIMRLVFVPITLGKVPLFLSAPNIFTRTSAHIVAHFSWLLTTSIT